MNAFTLANFRLGRHIGGSRADRAENAERIQAVRWMRQWKVVPYGDTYKVETGKIEMQGFFPTQARAEDALATFLAPRVLEPGRVVKDDLDSPWCIRQKRLPQIRIGIDSFSSRSEAFKALQTPLSAKRLLVEEAIMAEDLRKQAKKERDEIRSMLGKPFPRGYSMKKVDEGWAVFRRRRMLGQPHPTAEEAWDAAVKHFVYSSLHLTENEFDGVAVVRNGRKHKELANGFEDSDQAIEWVNENLEDLYAELTAVHRAQRDVKRIPVKEARRSENAPLWRRGHVEPEAFVRQFGFHGVEFGLWNSQTERHALLDNAWDALMDLSHVLGLQPKALSLGGQLSLAFGARGNGGNAAAHYEYNHAVINLTKQGGAGCLAHEWMHALDHHLARLAGSASSARVPLPDGGTGFIVAGERRACLSQAGIDCEQGIPGLNNAFSELMNAIRDESSAYRKNARLIDRVFGNTYWSKPNEMLARAFEAFVEDAVNSKGWCSQFLVNHTLGSKAGSVSAYPEGEERTSFCSLFNKLAAALGTVLS